MFTVVEKVVAGDVRTAARLIRHIDDGVPGVREALKALYRHTGNAYVVGITGAPGVGKSTLVDQMVHHFREKEKTVGVLAVDPTSPFSGGAILGDRIRMQRHTMDEGVFIRSLATRGHFGGLTQSTGAAIDVLDAMGKDCVIVETVGVGQDEIDVVKRAHTTVIVVMPGMGDDVQAVKAGILEAGDIFLINKSDREGAHKTLRDLESMIEMRQKSRQEGEWRPPVLMAQAVSDKGVVELVEKIEQHRQHIKKLSGDERMRNKRERMRMQLMDMIKSRLVEGISEQLNNSDAFKKGLDSIVDGTKDPYSVCDDLVLPRLNVGLS